LVFHIEEQRLRISEDRVLKRIFVSKREEVRQENGGNCVMRSFMIPKR
jgi:hypothetical protein